MVEERLLDVVNRHRQAFGRIVRFLRVRKKYTLRSLANKVYLSHAHLRKIEVGDTQITVKTLERLDSILNLDIIYDDELKKKFDHYKRILEQGIEYFDGEKLLEAVQGLEEDEDKHKRSFWMVDFYLAKLAYHNFTLFRYYGDATDIASDLSGIDKIMNEHQRQYFYLSRGVLNYNINDFSSALRDFELVRKQGRERWLKATASYFIGCVYSESYHLPKSNLHLDEAIQVFEEEQNTFRSMIAQIIRTGNRIRIGHVENVKEELEKQKEFAKAHELERPLYNIQMNEALYHLTQQEYDAALEVLDIIQNQTPGSYFYRAYAYLQKGQCEKVLENIVDVPEDENPLNRRYLVHRYSLAFLKAYCECDRDEYEHALKRFLDEAMNHKAYFETRIAYDYMVDFLQRKRRYKEAYQLTEEMIAITKTALC